MADLAEVASELPTITSEPLDVLRDAWAQLDLAVPDASPFLHPSWHETWLRHFGSQPAGSPGAGADSPVPRFSGSGAPSPVFLALRDGDDLIGVAALDMGRDEARLLGDHNVSDYAGVLALPGREEEVAAGVLEWLAEDLTPQLVLWGTAEDSPMRAAFAAAAERSGWSFAEEDEAVCPRAELPGDFEEFVGGLSKKDRHELRRKLRNLGAAGEVGFESVTGAAEIGARIERFLELMRISREDKDEFLTPAMEAFFRDLGQAFGELGLARLSTLTLDGASVAMILAFENESTAFLYNSGYDPAFAHLAVGLLSKAEAIRDCVARGKRTFDFLRGEEEYKRRLGGEPARVLTLRLARREAG